MSCDKVDKSKIEQQTCYEANKGAFINDVMQFWPRITPPLPPSLTLKWVFYLHLHKECHKITIPLLAWRHLWTPPKTHLSDCFFMKFLMLIVVCNPTKWSFPPFDALKQVLIAKLQSRKTINIPVLNQKPVSFQQLFQ